MTIDIINQCLNIHFCEMCLREWLAHRIRTKSLSKGLKRNESALSNRTHVATGRRPQNNVTNRPYIPIDSREKLCGDSSPPKLQDCVIKNTFKIILKRP